CSTARRKRDPRVVLQRARSPGAGLLPEERPAVGEPREPPAPESFLLDDRRTRVDEVVAGRTRSVSVVLDRVGDRFNQAAVLRTCEGLGVQEIHVVKHPVAGFHAHPTVTQGCEKWLDVSLYDSPAECAEAVKKRGYALWVSALGERSRPLPEL